MKKTYIKITISFLLLAAFSVLAQYQISQSVFGNGGIPVGSTSYSLNSTLGQPAIGSVQNTFYRHPVGFWYGVNIYVGIAGEEDRIPTRFELYQNYPNPFNPVTHIRYAVPNPSRVRIEIYNILGQQVRTLVNEEKTPGYYTVDFDASSLASGFYVCRMQAEGFTDIRKMIVTR